MQQRNWFQQLLLFASQTYGCDDLKLPLDYRALPDDRQVTKVAFLRLIFA
jgi:hypothetical protein